MEIESSNEKELEKTMKLFGVKDEPKFTGGDLYLEHYNIPLLKENKEDATGLNFDNAIKKLNKYITKNKDVFVKILKTQRTKLLKKKI